jgi:general secretion pathway protein L
VALDGQQWQLFGYDLREPGRQVSAAWRDILWGPDPVLGRFFDEPVRVISGPGGEARSYRAGRLLSGASGEARALVLPDEEVLLRELVLPASSEADLPDLVAQEVRAGSPFPEGDTRCGYALKWRDRQRLAVTIAITSAAGIQQWARQQGQAEALHDLEVWAFAEDQPVVIKGFAEQQRQQRIRQRASRSALLALVCLTLLLGSVVAVALADRQAMVRLMTADAQISASAKPALELRARLTSDEQRLQQVLQLQRNYGTPLRDFGLLTELLADDVSLIRYRVDGEKIRIEGQAENAAALLQLLTDHGAFQEVRAPMAFSRDPRSNVERFALELVSAGLAGAN